MSMTDLPMVRWHYMETCVFPRGSQVSIADMSRSSHAVNQHLKVDVRPTIAYHASPRPWQALNIRTRMRDFGEMKARL